MVTLRETAPATNRSAAMSRLFDGSSAFSEGCSGHPNAKFLHAKVKSRPLQSKACSCTTRSSYDTVRRFKRTKNLGLLRLIQYILKGFARDRSRSVCRTVYPRCGIGLEFAERDIQH